MKSAAGMGAGALFRLACTRVGDPGVRVARRTEVCGAGASVAGVGGDW